ncbi:MAG TPA: hypothetical protein VFI02_14095 [Armatimonadota bacterium]|nr:hypothetical protein [Armatimonadota bacterium]
MAAKKPKRRPAKRTAPKKKVVKKPPAKPRRTVRKTVSKASRLKSHQSRCKVCKSEYTTHINKLYKDLHPPSLIAKMLNGIFSEDSIKRHVRALDLLTKRNHSVLLKVRAILAAYEPGSKPPSEGLVAKALELEAKITKEISDNAELGVTLELGKKTRKLAEQMHQNFLNRLNGGPNGSGNIDDSAGS